MDYKVNVESLDKPEEVAVLTESLSELAEQLDVLILDASPDGAISARQGRIGLRKSPYIGDQVWINTNGSTAWTRIDQAATDTFFVTGDWIISSVTTMHSGWTNKSATYSNKFMRVNATPGTIGGSDTHNHGAGTGSHTLTIAEMPAHTHNNTNVQANKYSGDSGGSWNTESGNIATSSTGGGGGHTHTISNVNNIPAYVQVVVFEKN